MKLFMANLMAFVELSTVWFLCWAFKTEQPPLWAALFFLYLSVTVKHGGFITEDIWKKLK